MSDTIAHKVYLNNLFEPVDKSVATFAVIHFDGGEKTIFRIANRPDTYSAPRPAIGGARYETATNAYQATLEAAYQDWYTALAPKLEKEKDADKRDALLIAALAELEVLLTTLGRENLTQAFMLGARSEYLSPQGYAELSDAINNNEMFLANSLIPAIRTKVETGLRDPLVVAGGSLALAGLLATFVGRVSSYAGAYWNSIFHGVGDNVRQREDSDFIRIERELDPNAEHCDTCPPKARVYANWDAMVREAGIPGDGSDRCFASCRCILRSETYPGSGDFVRI